MQLGIEDRAAVSATHDNLKFGTPVSNLTFTWKPTH